MSGASIGRWDNDKLSEIIKQRRNLLKVPVIGDFTLCLLHAFFLIITLMSLHYDPIKIHQ